MDMVAKIFVLLLGLVFCIAGIKELFLFIRGYGFEQTELNKWTLISPRKATHWQKVKLLLGVVAGLLLGFIFLVYSGFVHI